MQPQLSVKANFVIEITVFLISVYDLTINSHLLTVA